MSEPLSRKIDQLHRYLNSFLRAAVAFSGGVDSTVLLHVCTRQFGSENTFAFFCDSCLQSKRAKENARQVIKRHFSELPFEMVELSPLEDEQIRRNSTDRCYYCKKTSFSAILERVNHHGSFVVFDGTNLDDRSEDRPGMRAASELGVRSPLAEAGLTKDDIRSYARLNNLINAELPSNSCLATRIPTGKPLGREELKKVEAAEDFLYSLGITGCRVRVNDEYTLVELQEKDIGASVQDPIKKKILSYFREYGYPSIFIRLLGR